MYAKFRDFVIIDVFEQHLPLVLLRETPHQWYINRL